MQSSFRVMFPVLIVCIIFFIAPLVFSDILNRYNVDSQVLLFANLFFFLISLISFSIQRRGMQHKNPHVFVRSVMSGMMVKMILCIAAVFAYVYLSGRVYNKRGIFLSLMLYLVYLFTETIVVMKMNKKQHA